MQLDQFVSRLKDIYETNLEAIVLFGSAAYDHGEWDKKYSDYNLAIVLASLAPVELQKSASCIRKWTKSRQPAPLFFDRQTIVSSLDVFPIEFSDIQAHHKLLYGQDPFQNLMIDTKNLRHQCEYDLRRTIISLRHQFVLNGHHSTKIIELMVSSISSVLSIFKGILMLTHQQSFQTKTHTVEKLATLIPINPTIFLQILTHRQGKIMLERKQYIELFEEYLTSLEAVITYIDQL